MSRHTFRSPSSVCSPRRPPPRRVYAPQVYSRQVPRRAQQQAPVRYAAAPRREMGGGFIEFLFNGTGEPPRQLRPSYQVPQYIDPLSGAAPRGGA